MLLTLGMFSYIVCLSFLHVGLRRSLLPTEFSVVELLLIPTNGSLRANFHCFGHVISDTDHIQRLVEKNGHSFLYIVNYH